VIDCAQLLTWFIENYPDTVKKVKNADEEFWEKFK
jgi:hypothetical protein